MLSIVGENKLRKILTQDARRKRVSQPLRYSVHFQIPRSEPLRTRSSTARSTGWITTPASRMQRTVRRQFQLARTDLDAGQLPPDREPAKIPLLFRRRATRWNARSAPGRCSPSGKSPPRFRAGWRAIFRRDPEDTAAGRCSGPTRNSSATRIGTPYPFSTNISTPTKAGGVRREPSDGLDRPHRQAAPANRRIRRTRRAAPRLIGIRPGCGLVSGKKSVDDWRAPPAK